MIPLQTTALARIWWPLVLTTNYDDCFYWAAIKAQEDTGAKADGVRKPVVLGRSRLSCQRVLHSLGTPHPPVLWALQGFLGGQHPKGNQALKRGKAPWSPELYDELVVGHEEYRRVTHNSAHFRRAFAEVFRTRTLWFLGSGLSESYFQDLFGEILEMYGPNPSPHYAFVEKGKVDPQFLSSRFNIVAAEYTNDGAGDHRAVPEWIGELERALNAPRAVPVSWGYSPPTASTVAPREHLPGLEVVRGTLPALRDGESVAVSAGETRVQPWFSQKILAWVKENVPGFSRSALLPAEGHYVLRVPGHAVYVVVARAEHLGPDTRDARAVLDATRELLACAAADGQKVVRSQLLSAGKSRTFPAVTSLIQMVRGYAAWSRETTVPEEEHPRLVIHVTDPSVLFALSTGRVGLTELLTCEDIRFWTETVRRNGGIDRNPMLRGPGTLVREIIQDLDIPAEGWQLDLHPHPYERWEPMRCDHLKTEEGEDVALAHLGVLPGSTLQFLQLAPEEPPKPSVKARSKRAGPSVSHSSSGKHSVPR